MKTIALSMAMLCLGAGAAGAAQFSDAQSGKNRVYPGRPCGLLSGATKDVRYGIPKGGVSRMLTIRMNLRVKRIFRARFSDKNYIM